MDKETINFYDAVSGDYSTHRYTLVTESYSQHIFKKRRDLFLVMLGSIEKNLPKDASILEVGCADGVLFKAVEEKFPGRFSKLVGMDISPKMIEEAKKQNTNPKAVFYLKDQMPTDTYDLVIELGVHPFDLDAELAYASSHLRSRGYFLYDLVSSESLFTKIKLKDKPYIKDYQSYRSYETSLRKYFSIIQASVYGLFVPKLWAVPAIGRNLQPVFDTVFKKIAPELFHEKIYLLQKPS